MIQRIEIASEIESILMHKQEIVSHKFSIVTRSLEHVKKPASPFNCSTICRCFLDDPLLVRIVAADIVNSIRTLRDSELICRSVGSQ